MDNKHKASLDRLRTAIIEDVREDFEPLDNLVEWHASLVSAWNAFAAESPDHLRPILEEDVTLPRVYRDPVAPTKKEEEE